MALRKRRLANLKVGLDSEMVAVLTKMWGVQVHGEKATRRWERQMAVSLWT